MNEVDNQSFLNSQELWMVFWNCDRKVLATFRGGERNMRYPLTKNVIVYGSTMVIIIPLKKRNSCIPGSLTVPKAD